MTNVTAEVLHENETYEVFLHTNPTSKNMFDEGAGHIYPFALSENVFLDAGYVVKNKTTKVVEYTTPQIADAIHNAEAMNDAFLTGAWKWFKVRRMAIADGRIPDENEMFLKNAEKHYASKERSAASAAELVK